MTFLTKPSITMKKTLLIRGKCDEESVEVRGENPEHHWSGSEPRLSMSSLLCLTLAALMVTLAGIVTGFMLYRQYIRVTSPHRYQGYCTIPIRDPSYYEPNYRVMPLRWSSEPDVQVLSAVDDRADELARALQEELDIGDTFEKISVIDNGRHINFIHDFEANVTGIVDPERCFFMELDPALVLAPELFVLSIEGGAEFDVSHVRSTLRAALPALAAARAPRALPAACAARPLYRLLRDDGLVVRKRGVDAPPHDYLVFAGRHVQEIQISNLGELLQREQQARAE